MGSFFTSTQIYNPNLLDREHFINFFCEEMKKNGYVTSNSDASEVCDKDEEYMEKLCAKKVEQNGTTFLAQ